jgi:F-type H+-transporting ATPase subunit delta
MISGSIPRRYARALREIGRDGKNLDALTAEVEGLAATVAGSPELARVLGSPSFTRDERGRLLVAVLERLRVSPLVKNFARLLLERERIGALPGIARELRGFADEDAGRVRAELRSATPLTPESRQQVERALGRTTGRTVLVEEKVDPALLGGVAAKVGDILYDGSLRAKLERLREQLR